MTAGRFGWRLLSSDSHIVEPPHLWAERIEEKYRDRAPHVVEEADADWWFVDDIRTNSFQGGAQAGKRFESQDELRPAARFREVRPGAYQPDAYLRDNELDGVYGSIIYPTEGLQPDTESTFPRSRAILEGILGGVPEDEQRRITQANTARLYGFATS